MALEWLTGEIDATCPVCSSSGSKRAVLSTGHLFDARTPIRLLRCAECGAGFLEDRTIPDYERELAEVLDYYVEQGAGIDLIVAPLRRIPAQTVRRCLEIGCSFGYALDFSRHSFGWDVLGVDPSPLARYGEAALGIPILHEYFGAASDVGPESFDLVLCSEILEHVAEPHALLAAIFDRLSPEGILVLSTPNVEIVRKETDHGMLARALSAGLHLILYDRASLARVLRLAGFEDVLIEVTPETLRAFASRGRRVTARLLPADPAAEGILLRDYLDVRKREVPADSILASGFGYRHLKECVNAGLYDEAIASREHLTGVFRERYGLDLDAPSRIHETARHPFNLTGALFFCGILELNGLGRPDRAAAYFAAAIEAYAILLQSPCPFALYDGETEELMRQSWKHLPMALAATDPDAATRAIESLAAADRDRVPLFILDESEDSTFVRLVNYGAYEAASRLVPRIVRRIDDLPFAPTRERAGALDPLYCLAMLALQTDRPAEAADLFRRVQDHAAGAVSDEWNAIQQRAHEHEELALQRLGRHVSRTSAGAYSTEAAARRNSAS
jgi:2-polyprenyl-3-methyl-5-hydroxy-6-metoxy-1,4-benzoquinol methylase